MKPGVTFISQGRAGIVEYHDENGTVRTDYEFGGGDCVAFIFVPSDTEWVSSWHRSPESKDAIMTVIAEEAIRQKAPNCYYRMSEKFIEIFRNP
jgi:hypothetical protein